MPDPAHVGLVPVVMAILTNGVADETTVILLPLSALTMGDASELVILIRYKVDVACPAGITPVMVLGVPATTVLGKLTVLDAKLPVASDNSIKGAVTVPPVT